MIQKFTAENVVAALMGVCFSIQVEAQEVVNIPDANFKGALVANSSINKNGDNEIQKSEAQAFTGFLNVAAKNIADLTGIEAFTAITGLYCYDNQLTTLDVSSNLALASLRCNHNQLTNLDVSANTNLSILYCHANQLTNLNLGANTKLSTLWCFNNFLSKLDVSANFGLTVLHCAYNSLTALDASANTQLVDLECHKNQLTSINVQNGNNSNFTVFNATGNPNLTCIQVDDVAYSQSHWTNVDAGATFSTNCSGSQEEYVTIPDSNFKAALVANSTINKNGDGEISFTEASSFTGAISVASKSIADMTGLEAFTSATGLICYGNQLTTLNVNANTALTTLRCNHNQLTALDVSANSKLTALYCHANQLTSLNVNNNQQLATLWCFNNQLETLSVSGNTNLKSLQCAFNQIGVLNVSSNRFLTELDCRSNQLTALNVQNGNNTNFTLFNSSSNALLACIQVDDPAYSEAHWTLVDPSSSFSTSCEDAPNVVYIPDANFKAALLANTLFINTNGDGEIQWSEARNYRGAIKVPNKGISDLTGIEAFTLIKELDCNANNLSTLNVGSNKAMTILDCSNNKLTSLVLEPNIQTLNCAHNLLVSLDIRSCTNLNTLDCSYNQLTALDVDQNVNLFALYSQFNQLTTFKSPSSLLMHLWCFNNKLTSMDVSGCDTLTYLFCNNNQLTSLDMSPNKNLFEFHCDANKLTNLTMGSKPILRHFWCGVNQLSSLDVSAMPSLWVLDCRFNQLTSLDLGQNRQFTNLVCVNNKLTSLNLRNGNNRNIWNLRAYNNPDLRCVQVDDVQYSQSKWVNDPTNTFKFDPGVFFSTDCAGLNNFVNIPDPIFKNALVTNFNINTNRDSEIQVAEAEAYHGAINVSFKNISSLTGIEAFTSITSLNCRVNKLTSLDVTHNPKLTFLDCYYNQIPELDVRNSTNLVTLNCGVNRLSSLDVSLNTKLNDLDCGGNQLTQLDVTADTLLTKLNCGGNQLTTLDISSNLRLVELNFGSNPISSIDVRPFTALTVLQCDDAHLSQLDVTANTRLQALTCNGNQLTSLDLSANTDLQYLYCIKNQLASLDVSASTKVQAIECQYNQLTSLKTANHVFEIWCHDNKLTSLSVEVDNLFCQNNELTSLEGSIIHEIVQCEYNKLVNLDLSASKDLGWVSCDHNDQLVFLNLQNGNNTTMDGFNATNNPNLVCVQVDDVTFAKTNWSSYIDSTAHFSTNCSETNANEMTKANNSSPEISVFPNPTSGVVTVQSTEPIDGFAVYDGIQGMRKEVPINGREGDMSTLPKGVYILHVRQGERVYLRRVVKN